MLRFRRPTSDDDKQRDEGGSGLGGGGGGGKREFYLGSRLELLSWHARLPKV